MIQNFSATVISFKDIAEQTPLLTITKPDGFSFTAGQFVKLILPHIQSADLLAHWRWFSLASAPYEDTLAFCGRHGRSLFKQALVKLKPGEAVEISKASGKFVLPTETDPPIVFLAGGVGVTPVRSIIRQSLHDQTKHQLTLFYSNYTTEDSAFLTEFQQLASDRFTLIPTMTTPDKCKQPWPGETGYIDAAMIKRHLTDMTRPLYYVVGSPGFITAMTDLLNREGVAPDHIKLEKFTGL